VSYADVFVILASKVLADRKSAPRFGYQPHSTSTQAIQPPGPIGNRFRTSSVEPIFIFWRFGAETRGCVSLMTLRASGATPGVANLALRA
jgi:hypothetical protein